MQKVVGVKNLVFCALCCAFTCVCALFTIPIGAVPITLCNLAIYISGAILGPVYGAISQIIYLALVFVGFPFTSQWKGGPFYLVGPTAGYMYGYVFIAFLTGYVYKVLGSRASQYEKKMMWMFIGCFLGTIVCYFFGTVWFVFQNNIEFFKALKVCVYPFILGDLLKILVAPMIVPRIEKAIKI